MKESIHPESITTVPAAIPHNFGERLTKLETEHKHMAETQTEILGILKRLVDMAQTTRQDIDKLQAEVRAARTETKHLQKQMVTHEHMARFQKENHEKLANLQKENRQEMARFQAENHKALVQFQEKSHKSLIEFQAAAHRRETQLLYWIVGMGALLLVAVLGAVFAPQYARSAQHGLTTSTTDTRMVSSQGTANPRKTPDQAGGQAGRLSETGGETLIGEPWREHGFSDPAHDICGRAGGCLTPKAMGRTIPAV